MTGKTRDSIIGASMFLFLMILFVYGCGSDNVSYDPAAAYQRAVSDASRDLSADRISKNLIAITPDNPDIIWEDNKPGTRVLVVSWVTEPIGSSYLCPREGCSPTDTCKVGRECPNFRYDTWVTVAPELKKYFKGMRPEPLRIAQSLGLPPTDASRKAYFLELWVYPKDLFRPCPDPEITDSECEINFPPDGFWVFDRSKKVYADQGCTMTQCGFMDYKGWFQNRRQYLYTAQYAYPWTGLGYTYDWGRSDSSIGLSEFVLLANKEDGRGVSVKINAVIRTDSYFN